MDHQELNTTLASENKGKRLNLEAKLGSAIFLPSAKQCLAMVLQS